MYAQGRRLHVHTPQVLGCTPPTIIHHFSFQSAPGHDIQRFTSHTRTKSHIEVYPLSTQSMLTTTATRWCPIGIVIHGYRRCQINGRFSGNSSVFIHIAYRRSVFQKCSSTSRRDVFVSKKCSSTSRRDVFISQKCSSTSHIKTRKCSYVFIRFQTLLGMSLLFLISSSSSLRVPRRPRPPRR